jgi:hypothetical protein
MEAQQKRQLDEYANPYQEKFGGIPEQGKHYEDDKLP